MAGEEHPFAYRTDHLGSPIRFLGEEGEEQALSYDEFGVPTAAASSRLRNPFGFTGYQTDDTTGLYYAQARYYSPNNARFVSEDPISARINWYAYCMNNPVRYIDPQGLDAIVINKPIDNDPTKTIEHMSLLVESANGDWNYFFYGDTVYYDKITDPDALKSLDDLNEYLSNNNNPFGHPYLLNDTHIYTRSIYIKGDFSQTELEAIALSKKYFDEHEETPFNKDYNLLWNNCSQKSLEILFKGMLPGGMTVREYFNQHGFEGGLMPNLNWNFLQQSFYNNAFTEDAFNFAMKELRKNYEDQNWLMQFLTWYIINDLSMIDDC